MIMEQNPLKIPACIVAAALRVFSIDILRVPHAQDHSTDETVQKVELFCRDPQQGRYRTQRDPKEDPDFFIQKPSLVEYVSVRLTRYLKGSDLSNMFRFRQRTISSV